MNAVKRIKCIKAMEFLARQLNDEEIFDQSWLTIGVADGDIKYGDLDIQIDDLDNLEYYWNDDENFADLMDTFLFTMSRARKSGGLYCDGVVSESK